MFLGGEEGTVKIWDLRAGKMMTEFHDHKGPVTVVEFHPHEFLLASASVDRTVNFWDLETFKLVSKSEKDTGDFFLKKGKNPPPEFKFQNFSKIELQHFICITYHTHATISLC